MDYPYLDDAGFVISLLGSTVLAFVLNYAIFFNTAVNSALTQSVCGQVFCFVWPNEQRSSSLASCTPDWAVCQWSAF